MRGCLSLPFRLLALALLVLGGYVAWSYRDEIRRRIHAWTAETGAPEVEGLGDAAQARAVQRKLDALAGRGRDSVVLSPVEVASLLAGAAAERIPGALDSIVVRLDQEDIEVRARVDTRKVPLAFGPLSGVIRDHETVEAGGRLLLRRAGLAEWQVFRARVRGIPLPRDVLGRLLDRVGGGTENVVPVPLPPSVGGLRVASGGVVVYGLTPAGVRQ
ncbi:MAG TPA: hypothetical protein VGQ69_05020 [Gemmatimonadales bacterium]|jgi:hypothetical protein|nr:hypothetical protein [Gemmatimonadales bacterium]